MTSSNETSSSECTFPMAYKVTVSSLLGIVVLLSPVLNLIVCYTIFSVKKLHSFGNLLIANLSLSDIIISLSLPSMEIIYVSIYPKWLTGKIGTYILNCVWMFSLAAPFVIVTIITVERFKTLKTLLPVKSKLVIRITLPCMWLYIFSAVAFMGWNFTPTTGDAYEWNVLPVYYYPYLGIHIVIPLIVIVVLYIGILRMTRSSRQRTTRVGSASGPLAKREMKVAKTIAIVIGLMFAIWIPALVLEYFYAIGTESCIVQMAGPVSVWLSCSNGVINPLLYFYRNPILRGEIVKKLPKSIAACFKSAGKGEGKDATPGAVTNKGFRKGEDSCVSANTNTANISIVTESISTVDFYCQKCKAAIEDTRF